MIWIELAAFAAGVLEAAHIVDKVRENDVAVGEIEHPFGLPLERYKPVVIDRRQGLHHIGNREVALADNVVAVGVVAVAKVHVLDVCAKVGDCLRRRFALVAEGVVHIPNDGNLVAGEKVEQIAQQRSVGVYSAGFYQDSDSFLFGNGNQFCQILFHLFNGALLRESADVGAAHIGGKAHQAAHLVHCGGVVLRKVERAVEARNGESALAKVAQRRHQRVFVERAAFGHELWCFENVVYLDAREAHLACVVKDFGPRHIGPSAC